MNRILAAAAFFCILLPRALFASANDDLEKGTRLFEAKKYIEALESYEKALSKRPGSGIVNFNIGDAHYRKGSYTSAIASFNKAIASGETKINAPSDYNIGNTEYRIGASEEGSDIKSAKDFYEIALEYYKRSMDLDPSDRDAKFNYEYVSARLKSLDESKQTKEEKRQEKKEDKNKDKKEEKKEEKKKFGDEQKESQGGGQGSKNKDESGGKGASGEGDEKDEGKEGMKGEDRGADKGEDKGEEGKGHPSASLGTRGMSDKEKGDEEAASGEKEGQWGLEFYQTPQEPREMSPDEAKMLLEGYKGEEATGKAVRLRRKVINMEEPLKDW